jgi:hypothetical protein
MSFIIGRGRYARAAYPVASSGALSTDEKVKVTAADTTPNFLQPKLVAGTNITLTLLNPGGNEQIKIDAGGAALGVPFAAAYYDAAGVPTSVADYLAGKLDAFQRPGVHDFRTGPTSRGATYRLGAWSQDGDPTNVTSEGYIAYGANALGAGPSATDGALGFYEPNGYGVYNVIPGVNGGNTFLVCGFEDGSPNAPFGYQGFQVNGNANEPLFHVDRTGPNAGFVFVGQSAPDNASTAHVQSAHILPNRAQYRSSQYGANTGVPGISTFKSRGATVGSLVPCIPGDVIFRATAASVTQSGAIPLGGMISIQIPLDFPQTGQLWNATEFELQLTPYNVFPATPNARRVSFKVNADGEVQTLRGVRAGGPATLPANLTTGALWSSGTGNPNGSVTGAIGDLWSRTDGSSNTALYVKESNPTATTGWVGLLPGFENLPNLNIAAGSTSLTALAGGTNNTAIGVTAGASLTTGSDNTAIGATALATCSTGIRNVAVGSAALALSTTSDNTAVGTNALAAQTTGSENTAIGYESMAVATSAAQNVGVGINSLGALTTGIGNVAVGMDAGDGITSGADNVSIGRFGLGASANTSHSIAIGRDALSSTTVGECVAVGGFALATNVTGQRNVAVGFSAMTANSGGSYNVALGHAALSTCVNGDGNTALGNAAAIFCTGFYNTCIGADVATSLSTGGSNIVIGHTAGATLTTGSGNVLIADDVPTAGTSDYLGIGAGTITGDLAAKQITFRRITTAGIVASTTQAQGNGPLTSDVNQVSVVANANDTVTLPSALAGWEVIVINSDPVNTLQVFPALGNDLGAGVNNSTTQAPGVTNRYLAYDTTNWVLA